jgi:hypothetical protein
MTWPDFWTAFLPGVTATLVGVALGLPIALWINHAAHARVKKQHQKRECSAVAHALQVLATAVGQNHLRLVGYAKVLTGNETLFDTGLDASAWDAVQRDLTAELRDPALRQRLAYYFSRLGTVVKLNDLYVKYMVGLESVHSRASVTRQALKPNLEKAVTALQVEGPELFAAISAARQRLVPSVEPLQLPIPE